MSEIFDFLRKNQAGSKPMPPVAPPEINIPPAEPVIPPLEFEQDCAIEKPAVFVEPTAVEIPVVFENTTAASDAFDLTDSTYQLRNVLDTSTVVGEQFRVLRSRLNLMQKQSGIKTVLVTSTVPQEGKSFTASGLAGVFAQEQGKRVVVVDADMRKPGSGRVFGLNGSCSNVGTAQILQGGSDFRSALMTSANPQFWFLPAGALPANPSELLSSPVLERMLKSAAEIFDWVIIDAPPILSLSDATLIAPLCDIVLLVVRANSTPSKLIAETINRIGANRICGIVLNRQKQIHSSRYYYQYYYRNSAKKE
jgi:capsular exopolysaccharide synthesis family protein